MKPTRSIRLALALLPFLAAASPLAAQLARLKEWDKSPEYLLLATSDEQKAWKKVATDEEGDKFVALFWARRDPDIKTPQNEFRQRFDVLVAKADELFKLGSRRGALTERGKLLILVGPPKSLSQKVESSGDQAAGQSSGFGSTGGAGTQVLFQFSYEQPQLPPWSDVKALAVQVRVDTGTGTEAIVGNVSDVRKLEKKAVEVALVNPNLKEVPVYKTREQVEAETRAANEAAAEAARGPALSAPVREQLEALLAKEPSGQMSLFPLAFRDGANRVEVQLFAPGAAIPAGEEAKQVRLALLAKGKDGKDAARREEPAALARTKGDWYTDRALLVGPGTYDVAVLLLDGAGKALVSARKSVTVEPLPKEFAASALLIAFTDVAADGAKPDDPYIFSYRKFITRGDGRLEKTDGLSYAFRVYNPGVDPVTRKTGLKRTISIKPKNGAAQEVPMPPEEPSVVPDAKDEKQLAVVLDMAGSVVDANLGDYFKPGEFEFRMKITDSITGKSLTIASPFTMVGPPPSAAPAPAPAPKKK